MNQLKFLSLIIFLLTTIYFIDIIAKSYDGVSYICADETGPLLEFSVPNFNKNSKKVNILLKVYEKKDRKLFDLVNAIIQKKSSAIDPSYFFYFVNFSYKKKEFTSGYFEFYPPSNLMYQNNGSTFESLVCWK